MMVPLPRKESIIKFLAIVAIAGLTAVSTYAGAKLAPDLEQSNPNANVDVIVQFKTAPTKNELKELGPYGQVKKTYSTINGINVSLPVSVIQQLESDPNLAYISPNRISKGAVDISTGTVNAPLVWSYGFDGSGVGVAVLDSSRQNAEPCAC